MSSTSPGVPGFETINVLAEGSSTIVRARSLDDGRDVIVKLLDPASEPILPRRFDRRRRVLRSLSEPGHGFVPLIDHGFAGDGRSYLVVPFLALGSLQDQIDRGPTPWYPASQLMAKVAEAVGRAHRQDAPLGDIRPSKILLQGADTTLVAAFGMASRRFDDGRPSYRAPEADNDTPPSAAADVFSLALVLATLIAGRPKERNEPTSDFLVELIGLAPARIHDVLEHGLAESVTNRYRNAAAMHRALARAIDTVPDQQGDADDASPVDLDDLLTTPVPVVEPPDIFEQVRTTADGLPADLDDLVLADDHAEDTGSSDDDGGADDHLLLPAGLDDIVLAPPSPPSAAATSPGADDDTTPFPLEAPADDGITSIVDLPADGTAEPFSEVASANGSGSDAHPRPAPTDADEGHERWPTPAEHADGSGSTGAGTGTGTDDSQEIVDLTELFTRTHEFVYDPEIHGRSDHPIDDGARSGDGQAPVRPPGEPSKAPSTTTTLLRHGDPPSDPDLGTDQQVDARAQLDIDDRIAGDDPGTEDRPVTDGPTPIPAPAPPEMPARRDLEVAEQDETHLFPEADEATPPWLLTGQAGETRPDGGPVFLDPDTSDAIPFPNMGRIRNRVDDHRWQARARTRAELLWFRGRRTLGTIMAVLGLIVIVAIVVIFAARELRSATTSVDTEGVPQPLTTATTGVNYLSTDAPFVTDVPPSFQPTTATTARRRAATTAGALSTNSPPVTPTAPPATDATEPPSTEPPPSTIERPSTTERTTRTRRGRRTTTTVATTSPTITTEVLPTTRNDDDDDDEEDGDGRTRRRDRDQAALTTSPPVLGQPGP